jgi:hypothetical protein
MHRYVTSLLSVLALAFAPHIGAADRRAAETLPEDPQAAGMERGAGAQQGVYPIL